MIWWALLLLALVATSALFTVLFVSGVVLGVGWPELLFCVGIMISAAWLSLGAQAYRRWMIRNRSRQVPGTEVSEENLNG